MASTVLFAVSEQYDNTLFSSELSLSPMIGWWNGPSNYDCMNSKGKNPMASLRNLLAADWFDEWVRWAAVHPDCCGSLFLHHASRQWSVVVLLGCRTTLVSRHLWHSGQHQRTQWMLFSRYEASGNDDWCSWFNGTTPQMPPFEQDARPPFLLGEIGPLVSLVRRTD